jgi:cellulose synthase/poly-beta-1,6-N-acetylglucosamine synthase-like glycosyltransferase
MNETQQTKLDDGARDFMLRHAADCSNVLIRWWQALWYSLVLFILIFSMAYRWDIFLCVINFIFAFWYFSIIVFRCCIASLSLSGRGQIEVADPDIATLTDDDLPMYTILVPLYKEANIAGRIVRYLDLLDYPPDKLDVKLLLEEDDKQTIAAVRGIALPARYDVIVVPDSLPKTKPKACNYGLKRSKGEYVVVFDAEDRPDPDQLKKALWTFRHSPEKVACVQAKLNYYNAQQNLLTRLFTIEYSTTFDLFLPGLECANIPMPLGGTSNHFKADVLKELDGWDPFNVTEDCELGVRLYRMGYRTTMVDSTTWEEATSRLWNWMRQRSRWVKGFFQTHLAHMRNPFRTLRELGPWGFAGFLMCVGGSSFMMIMNVVYWIIGGVYLTFLTKALAQGHTLWEILKGPRVALAGNAVWPMIYYGPGEDTVWSSLSIVFFVITCVLLLANLLFVYLHLLACNKRRFHHLMPYALLMPFYWILISIGAWKGFLQLFTNPFYWEKTIHGMDTGQADSKETES